MVDHPRTAQLCSFCLPRDVYDIQQDNQRALEGKQPSFEIFFKAKKGWGVT